MTASNDVAKNKNMNFKRKKAPNLGGCWGFTLTNLGNYIMTINDFDNKKVSDNEALGIDVKSQSSVDLQGLQALSARVERFALQDVARSVLTEMIPRYDGQLTYRHQVSNCLRARISKQNGINLFYNLERQKANFGNLQRCGSVWNCPICSMTITENRRKELSLGLSNWTNSGGFCYLVTFTNAHHKGDCLQSLIDGQKKAFVKFWSQRKVVKGLSDFGYVARIVATEVTYSNNNGWHPHYHMIFFCSCAVCTNTLQAFLVQEWIIACAKSKLKAPNLINGVDVRDGTYAAKYVSKWGLEHEVTKGHLKKGLKGSLTPFDLLRECSDNAQYKPLFKQFADVFKGRRQLVWSRGLKALLCIAEKTDEQLIKETDEKSVEVNELAHIIWELILKYNQRAHVLQLVEYDYKNNTDTLNDFIISLAELNVGQMIINSRS